MSTPGAVVTDIPLASVTLTINGEQVGPLEVPEDLMLVELLHEWQGLTGTRVSCGQGVCNACAVLLDEGEASRTVPACITGVVALQGKRIRTVEAHARIDEAGRVIPSPLQQAFLDHFSFQCSYCTPGFVNAATALIERLARDPVAEDTVEQVVLDALSPNLCRCTGYVRYLSAVKDLILRTPGLTLAGAPGQSPGPDRPASEQRP